LVFTAHGIPIDVAIFPPPPHAKEPAFTGINPQLTAGKFEGDMIFPDGFDPTTEDARGVAIAGNRQWPSRIIPYDISAITNAQNQKTITDAMQTLMYAVATPKPNTQERTACVYFRPRQATDKVFVKIAYGNGCSAHVGHLGRQSNMTLQQNGCFYSRTIQHELMHVLGFYHEQSRPDRDDHLQVNLENVDASMVHNFNKYVWGSTVHNQGSGYDYTSIMHYETTAFSKNGKPTMVPRKAGTVIGKSEVLSPLDIAEVRHYYGCTA